MRIVIGSDHAGVGMKSEIVDLLKGLGHSYEDIGTHGSTSVDYPDIAGPIAQAVAAGQYDAGIIICGTGIGVSITANKVKGIRAALCHDTFSAKASREHNHANVLCMGARVIGAGLARDIARTWLASPYSQDERHLRRIGKIGQMDC